MRAFALLLSLFVARIAGACTLGIEVTNISDRIRRDREIPDYVAGAIVRVGSSDLEAGDVIQAVGDHLIQNVCGLEKEIAARGCGTVKLTVRRGHETFEIDMPVAAAKAKRAAQTCDDGVPAACTALGKQRKSIDLFRRGCDLGDSEGCYLYAVNLDSEDPAARPAYRQACDDGNPLACTNLGWMLQFGHGGAIDLEEAVRLYRRGCRGSACSAPNNMGCVNLGRMLRDGVGVKADAFESTRVFLQVCDRAPVNDEDAHEIAHACSLAGTASLIGNGAQKDIRKALALLEKGCAAGDGFGCFNLATMYDNGTDVKEDKPRAMEYYRKACAAADEEACRIVATRPNG